MTTTGTRDASTPTYDAAAALQEADGPQADPARRTRNISQLKITKITWHKQAINIDLERQIEVRNRSRS